MNRRAIPAAVAATVLVQAAAQANPQRGIAELQALVSELQARIASLEAWREQMENVWPKNEVN